MGLYLSKYDSLGLRRLGFDTFVEAFNALGFALGGRPASIKNYRDEFDPLFPNRRRGWHKRSVRDYCLRVYEEYGSLDLDSFTALVKSLFEYDENAWSGIEGAGASELDESHFTKRLITGLAAERYFESVQPSLEEFGGFALEDTTRCGCGYDFRLTRDVHEDFLAVEVKGLKEHSGAISLTPKERESALAAE